jgi:hypothetical protein
MRRRTVRKSAHVSREEALTLPRHAGPASMLFKKWQRVSKAALVQVKEDAAQLKAACADSDMCMVLGMYDGPMNRFTDGFQNLHYLTECRRLGAPSINGFVFGMTFLRKGYKTFAVLKSTRAPGADNLMYEYRVGLFLNTKLRQLPNFVATYAAFAYTSAESWRTMAAAHLTQTALTPDQVRGALRSVPFDMQMGCRDDDDEHAAQGVHVAILVQNLPKPTSLKDLLDQGADLSFVGNILPILFQVYFALDALQDVFTHYDLHPGNVLLYEPGAGQRHVEFVYHTRSGKPLRFRSRYIAKIIDYGRSFFRDVATGESSRRLQQSVPAHCDGLWSYAHTVRSSALAGGRAVQDDVGDGLAGGAVKKQRAKKKRAGKERPKELTPADQFFIDSDSRNHSHDLRLLHETRDKVMAAVVAFRKNHNLSARDEKALTSPVEALCTAGDLYVHKYGTPEVESCSAGVQNGPKICTVADAAALAELCLRKQAPLASRMCFDSPLLGTLSVYHSGANFEWAATGLADDAAIVPPVRRSVRLRAKDATAGHGAKPEARHSAKPDAGHGAKARHSAKPNAGLGANPKAGLGANPKARRSSKANGQGRAKTNGRPIQGRAKDRRNRTKRRAAPRSRNRR